MNPNIDYCRRILKLTISALKFKHPEADLKKAWVIKTSSLTASPMWEFHYGDFFWCDSADNAYDARAKGWLAWMRRVK
jgi:hypothetical protein